MSCITSGRFVCSSDKVLIGRLRTEVRRFASKVNPNSCSQLDREHLDESDRTGQNFSLETFESKSFS